MLLFIENILEHAVTKGEKEFLFLASVQTELNVIQFRNPNLANTMTVIKNP